MSVPKKARTRLRRQEEAAHAKSTIDRRPKEPRNHQIIATAFGNGKQHDLQIFKASSSVFSAHICTLADAGYQGLDEPHHNSSTPAKKSKLHLLTKEQIASNRKLSRQRILVENVIRRLKIFRILSERYCNQRKRFALRFNLLAAIYNLELSLKN